MNLYVANMKKFLKNQIYFFYNKRQYLKGFQIICIVNINIHLLLIFSSINYRRYAFLKSIILFLFLENKKCKISINIFYVFKLKHIFFIIYEKEKYINLQGLWFRRSDS